MINNILTEKEITVYGDGQNGRDFIFVGDVVKIITDSIKLKNSIGIYNLGTGKLTKILEAIKNLRRCLSNQGKIIITFPIGYNPFLDELIKKDIRFKEIFYFKRVSKDNRWIGTTFDKVKQIKPRISAGKEK